MSEGSCYEGIVFTVSIIARFPTLAVNIANGNDLPFLIGFVLDNSHGNLKNAETERYGDQRRKEHRSGVRDLSSREGTL